jgi:hypothetical protein
MKYKPLVHPKYTAKNGLMSLSISDIEGRVYGADESPNVCK